MYQVAIRFGYVIDAPVADEVVAGAVICAPAGPAIDKVNAPING